MLAESGKILTTLQGGIRNEVMQTYNKPARSYIGDESDDRSLLGKSRIWYSLLRLSAEGIQTGILYINMIVSIL